jgi:hypothetical protein
MPQDQPFKNILLLIPYPYALGRRPREIRVSRLREHLHSLDRVSVLLEKGSHPIAQQLGVEVPRDRQRHVPADRRLRRNRLVRREVEHLRRHPGILGPKETDVRDTFTSITNRSRPSPGGGEIVTLAMTCWRF